MQLQIGISLNLAYVQSAGNVEHTDCLSAEGYPTPNKCSSYDIEQSDGIAVWEIVNFSNTIFFRQHK